MNAIEKWESKLREFQALGMSVAQATRETVVKFPEVHKEYLRAYNAQHGRAI